MDENKSHASGGFLFGVVVGAILALLFTTKKGRQILRMLTDEGLNKFADLEDLLQEKVHDMQDSTSTEDSDYVAPEEREEVVKPMPQAKPEPVAEKKTEAHVSEEPAEEIAKPKSQPKRFFRKSK